MLINLRNALMTGRRLPYDAEVEYLQSTGTQWIDTGVLASQDIKIEARFYRAISPSQFAYGVRSGSTTISCATGTSVSTIGYARWGKSAYAAAIPNTEVVVVQDKDGATVNGTHYNYTATESVVSQSGYTIALFAAKNSATTVTANLSGKFWYCKIWNNGVLVRDYIPVRKGTVGYLYDRVSGKLFGNAGTGDFVLGPDIVPVEYIESHGTEYIDTGVTPTDTTIASLSADYTYTAPAYLFGAISTNYGTNCFAFSGNRNGSTGTFRVFVSGAQIVGSFGNITPPIDGLSLQSCKLGANLCEIDSANYPFTYPSNLPLGVTHPIYLCARNNKGTAEHFAKMKIRGFAITTNNLPVRSFRPVRVGTEGAMMDTLTRRIYRNAGTGAFTYGNDLKYPIPAE